MKASSLLAALFVTFGSLVVGACGSDPPADAARACIPGTTLACLGAGQCMGVQGCNPDGASYGPCTCGAGDSGTNPGSDAVADTSMSQMDATTMPDVSGGGSESSASESSTSETGSSDAGSSDSRADAGAACTKVESSFACTPFVPADVPAGATVCTTADVRGFVTDCFSRDGSVAACSEWTDGTTPCDQCLQRWYDKDGNPRSDACAYVSLHAVGAITQQHCRDYEKCTNDCYSSACSAEKCSSTKVDGSTELDRCYDVVSGAQGACVEELTLSTACHDALFAGASRYCLPADGATIEYFFRGACRDNLDWSHADGG